MEFHGILSRSKVPWNSMELFPHSRVPWNSMEFHGTFNFPPKSSMEFHGIPWNFFWSSMEFHGIPWNLINFIFKKIIFLNIVFGIWLMIRCYLAKISQKRYKLHWFQYRNSYFEHPSVSENGTRSAKMACCCIRITIIIRSIYKITGDITTTNLAQQLRAYHIMVEAENTTTFITLMKWLLRSNA